MDSVADSVAGVGEVVHALVEDGIRVLRVVLGQSASYLLEIIL